MKDSIFRTQTIILWKYRVTHVWNGQKNLASLLRIHDQLVSFSFFLQITYFLKWKLFWKGDVVKNLAVIRVRLHDFVRYADILYLRLWIPEYNQINSAVGISCLLPIICAFCGKSWTMIETMPDKTQWHNPPGSSRVNLTWQIQ